MNIVRETESMKDYIDSLKEFYGVEFSDFELNVIRSAYINGYRKGYDHRIEDCLNEVDRQENLYAYKNSY